MFGPGSDKRCLDVNSAARFVGVNDKYEGRPLYEWIVHKARQRGSDLVSRRNGQSRSGSASDSDGAGGDSSSVRYRSATSGGNVVLSSS